MRKEKMDKWDVDWFNSKKNTKWFDCVKQPSETGKKVLVFKDGDLYVAIRIYKYYIPMPFATHPYSIDLCLPQFWSEIDFPATYQGRIKIYFPEKNEMITLSELEVDYPEMFKEFAESTIKSIATLKK